MVLVVVVRVGVIVLAALTVSVFVEPGRRTRLDLNRSARKEYMTMPSVMPMAMDVAAMPMRPGRSWSAQNSLHAGVVPPVRVLLIHCERLSARALRPFCGVAEPQHVRSEPGCRRGSPPDATAATRFPRSGRESRSSRVVRSRSGAALGKSAGGARKGALLSLGRVAPRIDAARCGYAARVAQYLTIVIGPSSSSRMFCRRPLRELSRSAVPGSTHDLQEGSGRVGSGLSTPHRGEARGTRSRRR